MVSVLKANSNVDETPDLETITSDLASLKHDFAQLARHLKLGATEGTRAAARGAAEQISGEAARVYENLAAQGERSARRSGAKSRSSRS